MITGIIIGVGITTYAVGAVFFMFLLATAGSPLFGVLFGLLWPLLAPIYWLRSKIDQNNWKRNQP